MLLRNSLIIAAIFYIMALTPAYAGLKAVATSSTISGVLPVANGGTGNTSAISERQRVGYAVSFLNQNSFGDSITQGNSASPITAGYPYLISNDLNTNLNNYGISGSQSCDISDLEVFANEQT